MSILNLNIQLFEIIEILLINGSKTDDFTETFLSKDDAGNIVEVKETNSYKVYEKIYLALQEDEIELSNQIEAGDSFLD